MVDSDSLPMTGTEDSLMGLATKESAPTMCDDAQMGPNESQEEERIRFQVELEFVQCLANPRYLFCTL